MTIDKSSHEMISSNAKINEEELSSAKSKIS